MDSVRGTFPASASSRGHARSRPSPRLRRGLPPPASPAPSSPDAARGNRSHPGARPWVPLLGVERAPGAAPNAEVGASGAGASWGAAGAHTAATRGRAGRRPSAPARRPVSQPQRRVESSGHRGVIPPRRASLRTTFSVLCRVCRRRARAENSSMSPGRRGRSVAEVPSRRTWRAATLAPRGAGGRGGGRAGHSGRSALRRLRHAAGFQGMFGA